MTNAYYEFTPRFIPGTKVRSGAVNIQFDALEAAFDLLPTSPDTLTRGNSTFGVESGSGNAYVVTMPNTRVVNGTGDVVAFLATHTSTNTATLQVDGIPPVTIYRFDGTVSQAGDLTDGFFYELRYDSVNTRFVIVSPAVFTVPAALVYGNPTATVGTTAVNGVAASVLRSDSAPALNLTISPTWTGTHTFSNIPVVPNDSFTYAKLQNVSATSRFLGRITSGAGDIEELTGTQATTLLDTFTSGLKGLVPLSGGGSVNFLRADGTFVYAAQLGDSPTWTGTHTFSNVPVVPNDSWTYAKIQNVSATSRFLGRITAGAGDIEELTGTQATTLLDTFTSGLKGLVPASGGGTTNYLRADGTFAVPPGTVSILAATKPADTVRTSTTTLADDPDLILSNLPSGTYVLRMGLALACSGGTQGYKLSLHSTSLTIRDGVFVVTNQGSNPPVAPLASDYIGPGQYAANTPGPAADHYAIVDAILISAGGANSIALSWAQNTSSGTGTRVKQDSYIMATKIA
jgi:hypothetical protein